MQGFYGISSYDRYNSLKPSFGLIFTMLYAARHVILVMLSRMPFISGGDTSFVDKWTHPVLVMSDLLVVMVLLAWRWRLPDSGKVWRKLWSLGRYALLVTLAIQFVLLAVEQGATLFNPAGNDTAGLVFAELLLDTVLFFYVLRSDRVRDVFADFPESPIDGRNKAATRRHP